MRFTAAALVASFTAATSAFLVPHADFSVDELKDTRYEDNDRPRLDPVTALIAEQGQAVDLDCPGCPFAFGYTEDRDDPSKQGLAWVNDVENSIHLKFDTNEHGFQVNGHTVFPLDQALEQASPIVKAWQNRKDRPDHSVEVPLNFAMEVMPAMKLTNKDGEDEGLEVVRVGFTVLGLNGIPVKVDTIVIHLLHDIAADNYFIARLERIPFEQTPGADTCEGARVWALCRVKAIIAARLNSLMEAARHCAHKVNKWVATQQRHGGCRQGNKMGHGGPGGRHHHHPHGHHAHHHSHRLGRFVHQTLRFLVIPALLGIVGGLVASAMGMLVGQAVVYLWRRAYRGGQRGPLRLVESEIVLVEEDVDEKDALLLGAEHEQLVVDEEQLPQYRDDDHDAKDSQKQ